MQVTDRLDASQGRAWLFLSPIWMMRALSCGETIAMLAAGHPPTVVTVFASSPKLDGGWRSRRSSPADGRIRDPWSIRHGSCHAQRSDSSRPRTLVGPPDACGRPSENVSRRRATVAHTSARQLDLGDLALRNAVLVGARACHGDCYQSALDELGNLLDLPARIIVVSEELLDLRKSSPTGACSPTNGRSAFRCHERRSTESSSSQPPPMSVIPLRMAQEAGPLTHAPGRGHRPLWRRRRR